MQFSYPFKHFSQSSWQLTPGTLRGGQHEDGGRGGEGVECGEKHGLECFRGNVPPGADPRNKDNRGGNTSGLTKYLQEKLDSVAHAIRLYY